jgi:anti-sigma regulatory factor (Ser/Thr protein kinase)/anti-anti-sigma regulatory factor
MSVKAKRGRSISIPTDSDHSSLAGFFEDLETLIKEEPQEIAVDCSLLEHTSSSHINALWEALTRCERAGITMRLTSAGYGLERVLRVLDLYDLFTVDEESREPAPVSRPVSLGRTQTAPLNLEFEPDVDGVADALLRFHDHLKTLSVSEICAFDLETVFYEVAMNICRHGGLRPEDNISFSATLDGRYLCLRFTDSGSFFDPTKNPEDFSARRAIRRKQRHGLGLTMIRRLVDVISYERVDDELNVVTLRKRLRLSRR